MANKWCEKQRKTVRETFSTKLLPLNTFTH